MMKKDQDNKIFAQLVQVMKDSAGAKIVHECPYLVSFHVKFWDFSLQKYYFIRSLTAET